MKATPEQAISGEESHIKKLAYFKARYLKKRELILEQQQRYRDTHKQQRSAYGKAYHAANPQRRLEYQRKWTSENRDRVNASNRRSKDKHRVKVNARAREHQRAHPEIQRRCGLKKNYGLSLAEYDAMLFLQGGACAICSLQSKKTLHVDHDHVSGRIRGLLCYRCNALLGYSVDDPERLAAAIVYLEKHK